MSTKFAAGPETSGFQDCMCCTPLTLLASAATKCQYIRLIPEMVVTISMSFNRTCCPWTLTYMHTKVHTHTIHTSKN